MPLSRPETPRCQEIVPPFLPHLHNLGTDEESATTPRKKKPKAPREPPTAVWLLILLGSFLRNMELTVIIPSSEAMSKSKTLDLAFSGFVVGSFGLGCVLGIFIFRYTSSYRRCFLAYSVLSIGGNALYLVALRHLDKDWEQYPALDDLFFLLTARIIKGLAAGGTFTFQMLIVSTTSNASRAAHVGWRETFGMLGNASGLMFGGLVMIAIPGPVGFEVPIWVMLCFSLMFFVAVMTTFPTDAELKEDSCFKNYGEISSASPPPLSPHRRRHKDVSRYVSGASYTSDEEGSPDADSLHRPNEMTRLLHMNKSSTARKKYCILALCMYSGFTRLFIRVGIEAGAVTVLKRDHSISSGHGGLIVGCFVFIGFTATALQTQFCKHCSETCQLLLQQAVCLLTAAAMAYPIEEYDNQRVAAVAFLVLCGTLYSVNVMSAPVTISLASKISYQEGHPLLGKRNLMTSLMVAKDGLGVLLGPWVIRLLIQRYGEGQKSLATVLMAMTLLNVFVIAGCMVIANISKFPGLHQLHL